MVLDISTTVGTVGVASGKKRQAKRAIATLLVGSGFVAVLKPNSRVQVAIRDAAVRSVPKTGKKGLKVTAQIAQRTDFCIRRQWLAVTKYSDEAVS